MAALDHEDPIQRVQHLDELSLRRIVTVESSDYRTDVVAAASQELARRGLKALSTRQFLDALSEEQLRGSDLFCVECYEASTDERFSVAGETLFRKLMPTRDPPCPKCGSVIREHHVSVFSLPLFRLASYRVKEYAVPWPGQPKILSTRKLRGSEEPAGTNDAGANRSSAGTGTRARSRWAE